MGQLLNDKDVERIATRVVQKLVVYALVILAAIATPVVALIWLGAAPARS